MTINPTGAIAGMRRGGGRRLVVTRKIHTMKIRSTNATFVLPYEVGFGNGRKSVAIAIADTESRRNAKNTRMPAASTWITRLSGDSIWAPAKTAITTTKA